MMRKFGWECSVSKVTCGFPPRDTANVSFSSATIESLRRPGRSEPVDSSGGSFDMEANPPAALTSNEEITLRRIAFGIGGGSMLRREDVDRLTKLGLVVSRGLAFALTAQGESRIARRSPERETLSRKEADAFERVLHRKL
jgi:hypothetical protein